MSVLTLAVPARPEALAVVRLVVMSWAATSGVDLSEIFARSQEVTKEITNVLMERPDARSIVISARAGAGDLDLLYVGEPVARA